MRDTIKADLAKHLQMSETSSFLLMGPSAPKPGWVYRDFHPMPTEVWLELLDLLGLEDVEMVACNPRQLPPAKMCRAQIFISPAAQKRWAEFLEEAP